MKLNKPLRTLTIAGMLFASYLINPSTTYCKETQKPLTYETSVAASKSIEQKPLTYETSVAASESIEKQEKEQQESKEILGNIIQQGETYYLQLENISLEYEEVCVAYSVFFKFNNGRTNIGIKDFSFKSSDKIVEDGKIRFDLLDIIKEADPNSPIERYIKEIGLKEFSLFGVIVYQDSESKNPLQTFEMLKYQEKQDE